MKRSLDSKVPLAFCTDVTYALAPNELSVRYVKESHGVYAVTF